MKKNVDIAIIGGGIIGMATAYDLSLKGLKVAVIERKYIGAGSTSRCIGGLRHQFSTPAAIRLMKESIQLFSQMEEEFGFSVEFHKGGYLLLAHDQNLLNIFKNNIQIQQAEGVDVRLLSPQECREVVPGLDTDGLLGGAYCPDDAQAFPFTVLKGYRNILERNNGECVMYNAVTGIRKNGNFTLDLEDGSEIEAEKVLLSAGPWARELGELVGLDLPLFPERHEAMITQRVPKFMEPMLVDYRSDGCYFHQLITGQIIGCYTPVPNVPGIREDVSIDFVPQLAQRMTRLVPDLDKVGILRHWSGCYTMTPDGNPIVDKTEIDGLYVAAGMCGHGFMFGPSIGKNLAHFMTEGEWLMDYSDFAIDRSFDSKETLK